MTKESETVESAVALALREVGPRDLVCVTGSLFVVAEAIEYLEATERDNLTG
jgi:folylpolyglutamate synthase/dihydropteroate synthase